MPRYNIVNRLSGIHIWEASAKLSLMFYSVGKKYKKQDCVLGLHCNCNGFFCFMVSYVARTHVLLNIHPFSTYYTLYTYFVCMFCLIMHRNNFIALLSTNYAYFIMSLLRFSSSSSTSFSLLLFKVVLKINIWRQVCYVLQTVTLMIFSFHGTFSSMIHKLCPHSTTHA